MKQNKSTKQSKIEYEKVFKSPLDWCPLFGYLPEAEEYEVCDNKPVLYLIETCLDIINTCRDNFGFDYRPKLHMKKYVRIPDIKILLPHADNDSINYIHSLRRLFQNLDFLSLKSASLFDINEALVNAINISYKTIRIEATFPIRPIGRVSNLYNDALSVLAEDIRLDRAFWRDSILVEEANKLTGDEAKIDIIKLISLYAILEAWLIVTRLLHEPKHEEGGLLFHSERLAYATALNSIAENHKNNRYVSGVFIENMSLTDKNIELENEINDIEVKTPRTPRKQSSYAKRRHEKEAPSIESRNKAIRDKVEEILKNNTKHKSKISVQFVYDKINRDFSTIIGNIKISQFKNVAGDLIRDFKQGRP